MSDQKPDIRYVIVHTPGPAWQPGVDFRDQPGVMQHVEYFLKIKEQGKVTFGGPFLDNSGGMMIPKGGLSEEEIKRIASEDPTIKSGLVNCTIRPWYIAMKE